MSSASRRRLPIYSASVALLVIVFASCAPKRIYRAPIPGRGAPVPQSSASPPSPAPTLPPSTETVQKPLPSEPRIREQDLKSKPPLVPIPEVGRSELAPAPEAAAPPLPDDSSLLAKITPGVSPQRAASLRLTDEGSKLLDAGEPAKALARLERTIVIDATNAYGYFYLAKAHFLLGRYRQSLDFLAVAESRLSAEPFWLAEVHALRGENYRAQGQLQRAESSYQQALRLNSGNQTAANALAHLQPEITPAGR